MGMGKGEGRGKRSRCSDFTIWPLAQRHPEAMATGRMQGIWETLVPHRGPGAKFLVEVGGRHILITCLYQICHSG